MLFKSALTSAVLILAGNQANANLLVKNVNTEENLRQEALDA